MIMMSALSIYSAFYLSSHNCGNELTLFLNIFFLGPILLYTVNFISLLPFTFLQTL